MAITITTSGPFYGTAGTPISFSSLRTNFRATDIDETVSNDTSSISASQLRRIVSQSNSDPTVPDATENVQISTGNDLSISQFRNSVKYYRVSQTSTDTNLNISSQTWNSNLSKNIKKKVSIGGTIGSSDTNIPALLTTSGQHCNLEIAVTGTGKVIGAGGTAGTANGGNGGNGGTAMNLLNTLAASVIKVTVASGANIYGGGGGGGAGNKGADGDPGTAGTTPGASVTTFAENYGCNEQWSIVNCPFFKNIATGNNWTNGDKFNANANYVNALCQQNNPQCGGGGVYVVSTGNGYYTTTTGTPIVTAGGTAGTGGTGGNGGVGAGYNQAATNAPALDTTGGPVTAPALNTTGGPTSGGGGTATAGGVGGNGITGGNGGDYGVDGTAANPGGNGGTAGRAIAGSNYSVTGTISGDTVKGLYNP